MPLLLVFFDSFSAMMPASCCVYEDCFCNPIKHDAIDVVYGKSARSMDD